MQSKIEILSNLMFATTMLKERGFDTSELQVAYDKYAEASIEDLYPPRCSAQVKVDAMRDDYTCGQAAVMEIDGAPYCQQHAGVAALDILIEMEGE